MALTDLGGIFSLGVGLQNLGCKQAQSKSDIFEAFITLLNREKVSYCILGNCDIYPKTILGDVDFMVGSGQIEKLYGMLMSLAASHDIKLVQAFSHETTACYFILSRVEEGRIAFLHPDACSDYRRKGRVWLIADDILQSRCLHPGNFFVPSPENAFLYYLIKRIDKGSLSSDHFKYLSRLFNESPERCLAKASKYWGKESISRLSRALANQSGHEISQSLNVMRDELHGSSFRESLFSRIRQKVRDIFRMTRRVLYPTGLFIVFLGPDGCGKSTIIERVVPSLSPAFRRTQTYHLRPFLWGKKCASPQPVTDPHGYPNRSCITSVLKILYFLFDYIVGYCVHIRSRLVRSNFVVFDRYFHDLLVDPKRYRFGAPLWMARIAGKLIPQPDIWFVLDAPPEILQYRKQEVSFQETSRQREEYLRLSESLINCMVIDASQPIDDVVAQVNKAILGFLEQRVHNRHGV